MSLRTISGYIDPPRKGFTHNYGLGGRVDGHDDTKGSQSNVRSLLLPCMCTRLIVKHCRINVTKRHATNSVRSAAGVRLRQQYYTYQAKLPTNATNLSRSFAPAQLSTVLPMTTMNLNTFFCHLTFQSDFPLRVKSPFSMIRTAGKSWSGTDNRIARE